MEDLDDNLPESWEDPAWLLPAVQMVYDHFRRLRVQRRWMKAIIRLREQRVCKKKWKVREAEMERYRAEQDLIAM